jgi:hypothetical protein
MRVLLIIALLSVPIASSGQSAARPRTLVLWLEYGTRIDGETVTFAGTTFTPYNIRATVSVEGVQIADDGTFSFEGRGQHHQDYISQSGGVRVQLDWNSEELVKGMGTLAADGKLSLDLQWAHGAGTQNVTTSAGNATSSHGAQAFGSVPRWELSPSRPTADAGRDATSDVIRYAGSRPSTMPGAMAVPITEWVWARVSVPPSVPPQEKSSKQGGQAWDLKVELIPAPTVKRAATSLVQVVDGGSLDMEAIVTNLGPNNCPAAELELRLFSQQLLGQLSKERITSGAVIESTMNSVRVDLGSLAQGQSIKVPAAFRIQSAGGEKNDDAKAPRSPHGWVRGRVTSALDFNAANNQDEIDFRLSVGKR